MQYSLGFPIHMAFSRIFRESQKESKTWKPLIFINDETQIRHLVYEISQIYWRNIDLTFSCCLMQSEKTLMKTVRGRGGWWYINVI